VSTKISDIYDALESIVSAALGSEYKRLSNPYDLSDNAEPILRRGYGIIVADGDNTQRFICGKRSYNRRFNVAIINQITTTDHNISAKKTIDKGLLEDSAKVFIALEADITLSETCAKAVQISDGGFEYAEGDRNKYLAILINVECEYIE